MHQVLRGYIRVCMWDEKGNLLGLPLMYVS